MLQLQNYHHYKHIQIITKDLSISSLVVLIPESLSLDELSSIFNISKKSITCDMLASLGLNSLVMC